MRAMTPNCWGRGMLSVEVGGWISCDPGAEEGVRGRRARGTGAQRATALSRLCARHVTELLRTARRVCAQYERAGDV